MADDVQHMSNKRIWTDMDYGKPR